MKAHVIENNIVVNTIEVDSLDFMHGLVPADDGSIGDLYKDGVFIRPEINQIAGQDYAAKRASQYPDFRVYLDGIVKGDQSQVQAYIDACLAVKAKYPKPEAN